MKKKFDNVPEIIETFKKIYPDAEVEKGVNDEGHLCLKITKNSEIIKVLEVRDYQASRYYITDVPDVENGTA